MNEAAPMVGNFAFLKVVSLTSIGAFLQTSDVKDLLLPFAEQTDELFVGDQVLIFVYLDKTERPCASMRIEKFLEKTSAAFKEDQQVELWIYRKTDLGYKAIVDGTTAGILYDSDVFTDLSYGEKLKGYIGKLRPDQKIDLKLSRSGHDAANDIAPLILKMLAEQNGFLALNEKTPPQTIYKLFAVSKKKYKMVLGGLYKKKLITIHDDGIRLVLLPS